MKINSISNQNFGKIIVEKGMEEPLYAQIFHTKANDLAKELLIIDLIEANKENKDDIYVRKGGTVEIKSKKTGSRSLVFGDTLLEKLSLALRASRTPEHKQTIRTVVNYCTPCTILEEDAYNYVYPRRF